MTYLFIGVAAIVFYEAFARCGTLRDVHSLNGTISEAFRVIRDPAASDLEKEEISRRNSTLVLKFMALTVGKIAIAVAISALILWLLCVLAGTPFQDVVLLSASPLVIVALVPLMLLYGWLRHVFRR